MGQIQVHILDPNNEPVMTELHERIVKKDIYVKLNQLAIAMAYGIGNESDGMWNEVILKNHILTMFSYTNAKTLNEGQLNCLVGRLFSCVDKSIPCNVKGIHF